MTLLEVLAALAILSGMLAGLLVAKQRAMRQQALAQRRLEAVDVADQLLRQWPDGNVPKDAAGNLPLNPDLWWQTSMVSQPDDASGLGGIVSLEVIGRADQQVLARVDLWVARDTSASVGTDAKKQEH